MVTIHLTYEGALHCQARHAPSGATLTTDAPRDNQGRGESFSPTDLVATALGSCMATIMGIAAAGRGLDLAGMAVTVEKEMIADPERRIRSLMVEIRLPRPLGPRDRAALEIAARHCPVHKSLHPAVEIPIRFVYPAE